jgi:formylglycine-generating enzyme required for sulfatase activity
MESNLACRYANGADQTPWPGLKMKWKTPLACNDRYFNTAPVGTYQPNDWGLSDLIGNVAEWVQDCFHANYQGAPADGAAWEGQPCGRRTVRGGSWREPAEQLRVARRWFGVAYDRADFLGFRIAR